MANLRAIHSVGSSLMTYLSQAYPAELKSAHPCEFKLFSGAEMAREDHDKTLSLFLYRISMNEHLRNVGGADSAAGAVPLSINLHYLLTIWASDALTEQIVLGWALRQLYLHETLTLSDLSPDANWGAGDFVQIIPAEISNEDMFRIWNVLGAKYRLSLSYVTRVVRIDGDTQPDARPVVERRVLLTDRVPPR